MTTDQSENDARLAAGLAAHRRGALDEAERFYSAVLAETPTAAAALRLLAVLALERGEPALAASRAAAAVEQRPRVGEYWHVLGRAKLAQSDWDAAAQAFERAVALSTPERNEALLDLAACQARRKAWPESLAAARAVLQERPDDLLAHRISGHACFALRRDAEGVTHFARVLAADRAQAGLWHTSSVMHQRLGNAVAAYEHALEACRLAPSNVEYAYQRRVSAAAAVPDWHFDMLHDAARNAAFSAAIAAVVAPEHLVLEIGSGAGLLALLAARGHDQRAGARRVVTCEANPVLAAVATANVQANGLAQRVRVIAKPSTELVVGVDLPELADVLLCEIFSVQVITEGVLPSLEDAKARLAKPDARVIPARASARGALVSSEALARRVRVRNVLGFDLSQLNAFSPVIQYLPPGQGVSLLSEAVDLFAFDLAGSHEFPSEKRTLELRVSAPGLCQGVLQWLRLDLVPGVQFENHPERAGAGESQHWSPVFYPFPEPLQVAVGQSVSLRVSHNRVGMRVELAS